MKDKITQIQAENIELLATIESMKSQPDSGSSRAGNAEVEMSSKSKFIRFLF